MGIDRRSFLQSLGCAALAASFPKTIARLCRSTRRVIGSIEDVEHIVILMQENRSDHYFGTLSGVRGFGDPRATSSLRRPVCYQPNGSGGYALPFHPPVEGLGMQLETVPLFARLAPVKFVGESSGRVFHAPKFAPSCSDPNFMLMFPCFEL
jgi:phospholipase C